MTTITDSPQPVAWAVCGDGYEYVSLVPEMCVAWATENGGRTVPLYATPDAASTPGEPTQWKSFSREPAKQPATFQILETGTAPES